MFHRRKESRPVAVRVAVSSGMRGFLRVCPSVAAAIAALPSEQRDRWERHVFICDRSTWTPVADLEPSIRMHVLA